MSFSILYMLISLFCIMHLSTSQNCYGQYACYAGYMDKTEGNGYNWACGSACPGSSSSYTDYGCNCACVPEDTCQPTSSPTIPTSEPSQSPTVPTIPTIHIYQSTSQTTSEAAACYSQYECNAGYMDTTTGAGYNWSCGSECPGKADYSDYFCNCACIPQVPCHLMDSLTQPPDIVDMDSETPNSTETINKQGNTWQFASFLKSVPFWIYIIAAVILCCVFQICCKTCRKKRREKIHYFPTATGINNATQPQNIHAKAAQYPMAQQANNVNYVVQPQQLPVVFVTPQQNQLIFAPQHAQNMQVQHVHVPSSSVVMVGMPPQNNMIMNPSAPNQDDVPPPYAQPYADAPPAYDEIKPEGQHDNNGEQYTNM